MFKKLMIRMIMFFVCFQLKRKVGIGKKFNYILNTKDITEEFTGKYIMYLPVNVHVDVKEDKYYFTFNGLLVGAGNLDQRKPEKVIMDDCISFNVLYQYIAASAIKDKHTMNKIFKDEMLFNYLEDELIQLMLMKRA